MKVIDSNDYQVVYQHNLQLYGTNLVNLLKLLCKEKDGNIDINFDDVVLRGVTVIRDGEVTWPAPPIRVIPAQPQQKTDRTCY